MLGKTSDGEEIGTRLADPGSIKPGDMKRIQEYHTQFAERMRAAKEIGEHITPETILELAKGNEFLTQQLTLMKPEQLVQVFRKHLPLLAIRDHDRFEAIQSAMDKVVAYRNGNYKHLDDRVTQLCAQFRVDQTRFVDIMREEKPEVRRYLLRQEIKKSFGGARNFFSGGYFTRLKAKALEDDSNIKKLIDDAMNQMSNRIRGVGELLGASVEKNDELREAFMQEVLGVKPPEKPQQAFKEMSSGLTTPKQAQEAWAKEKGTGAYKALQTENERETYRDNWKNDREEGAEKEAAEKGGFWATIGVLLLKALFAKEKFDL